MGERGIEARRSPRIGWSAPGRLLLQDRSEHRCRALDVSEGGIALLAPARAPLGGRVICYLDRLGRVEGRVVREFEGGFALAFEGPSAKRARLARDIAREAGKAPSPAAQRVVPEEPRTVMRLPDDRRVAVQILELSPQGASLTAPVALDAGAKVHLGSRASIVLRVQQRLVTLAFDEPLESVSPATRL